MLLCCWYSLSVEKRNVCSLITPFCLLLLQRVRRKLVTQQSPITLQCVCNNASYFIQKGCICCCCYWPNLNCINFCFSRKNSGNDIYSFFSVLLFLFNFLFNCTVYTYMYIHDYLLFLILSLTIISFERTSLFFSSVITDFIIFLWMIRKHLIISIFTVTTHNYYALIVIYLTHESRESVFFSSIQKKCVSVLLLFFY